jgi:dTDP-4-dehydrorhamnose reductase
VIWLVGSLGMLGSEVAARMDTAGWEFAKSDRDVDISSIEAIRSFARGKDIKWIVNCAAYTAVDKAESEPELAARLNVAGPRNLGVLAREVGAGIVHLSTDYVFSGEETRPYREEDPSGPTGVYGPTKAEGEAALQEECDRSIILRTAWLYGKQGSNFVYTILRLMREKEEVGIVADQRGSPTWAADLARTIVYVLMASSPRFGVYHFAGLGETSWFEFARSIQELGRKTGILERECRLRPLTTSEYPTAARRPAYSVLSTDKIARDYGIRARPWRESLQDFFQDAFSDARGFERIGMQMVKRS